MFDNLIQLINFEIVNKMLIFSVLLFTILSMEAFSLETQMDKSAEMAEIFHHLPNQRRILKVMQVQRHGNRAPSKIYDHLLPDNKKYLNF